MNANRKASNACKSRNLVQVSLDCTCAEEDHDAVGRKVSAMFLAQVEIEEDKTKDSGGGGNEGGEDSKEGKQKKGFLQGSNHSDDDNEPVPTIYPILPYVSPITSSFFLFCSWMYLPLPATLPSLED